MFYDRLTELCLEREMTVTGFLKLMGLSTSKVTYWKKSPPKADMLNKIAERFNVSVDYLLGASDIRTIKKAAVGDDSGLGKLDYEIIDAFQQLTSEQQKQALAYLAFLKLQQ